MHSRCFHIDTDLARRHLAALDDLTTSHIFVCVPEAPGAHGGVRQVYGTLETARERLEAEQDAGCGVFVTVNAMFGRRRLKSSVARVRALWIERDRPGPELPLSPSLVIETSRGKRHEYLLTDPKNPLDVAAATRINRTIAQQFGGDRQAADLARVLRLAGSWHLKGEPHPVSIVSEPRTRYLSDALLTAFPPPESEKRPLRRLTPVVRRPRYLAAAIAGVCADLASAVVGTRNDALNRSAFRLARLGCYPEEIDTMLTPIALSIGLSESETAATIKSGARAGGQASTLSVQSSRRS